MQMAVDWSGLSVPPLSDHVDVPVTDRGIASARSRLWRACLKASQLRGGEQAVAGCAADAGPDAEMPESGCIVRVERPYLAHASRSRPHA
jgi:hypothetical protein